jgi:hypothetical protein
MTIHEAQIHETTTSTKARKTASGLIAASLILTLGVGCTNKENSGSPSESGISTPRNPGEAVASHNGITQASPFEQITGNEASRAVLAKILSTTSDNLDSIPTLINDSDTAEWHSLDGKTAVLVGVVANASKDQLFNIDNLEKLANPKPGNNAIAKRLWLDDGIKGSRYAAYEDKSPALITGNSAMVEWVYILDEKTNAAMFIKAGPVVTPSAPDLGPAASIDFDDQGRATQLAMTFHRG